MYETPGGIPGVVDVSSTGNVVAAPSATCPAGTTGDTPDARRRLGSATCKPASDLHQPTGVGRQNQLAYYSNYGPRIDIAAPGGARKFNIPRYDRGGTPGFPYTTADGTTAYEDFSITSDWALEIPCFIGGSLGPAVLPERLLQHHPGHVDGDTPRLGRGGAHREPLPVPAAPAAGLLATLKASARHVSGNTTQPLSATDTSPGDYTGIACATGYCHNGGAPIPDWEAYGAGLVDAGSLGGFGR